jgi:sugar phosphate isomerase/epimerase
MMSMIPLSRREVLKRSLIVGAAAALAGPLGVVSTANDKANPSKMRFGLCTYLWGEKWNLPTLLANCEKAGVLGVELRVEHKHGVEPSLSPPQRREVRKRFDDSPVTFVGMGTNQCFDSPDPEQLKRSIEEAKAFVRLSCDCGGSGVKVKPNDFHPNVPHEKTIEQIGKSLNVLGRYAADFGQQIRLEVHGTCAELQTIKGIMDVAGNANVAVCWNCNAADLHQQGLVQNFILVENRLGATLHIHELDVGDYPYRCLIELLVRNNYAGWALLESEKPPKDPVAALSAQRMMFERMTAAVKKCDRGPT